MYNTPLFSAVKRYQKKQISPFFMPGHKLGQGIPSAFQMDLTELEETDNLHIPQGVIKEAQDLAAVCFGAKETFFLVNGSTGGIHAMFLATLSPGDEVIIARNCHVAAISALILCGAKPIFVYPDFIEEAGVYGGLSPKMVEQACKMHPNAKAVYVTSPDYCGFCSDLAAIADATHAHGMKLLVDEAHGCHFVCSDKLPRAALASGADLCVQSAHKTLPALTQSAYLHSAGTVEHEKIRAALDLLLSSSPSYVLMAYLDAARSLLEAHGKEVYETILQENEKIKALPHLFADRFCHTHSIFAVDPSRIAVFGDFSAASFGTVVPEAANNLFAIFLPSFGSCESDFSALYAFLQAKSEEKKRRFLPPPAAKCMLSPRDCFFAQKDYVPLRQAAGKIAAAAVAPYPPGVPVLIPGEEISEETIAYLSAIKAPLWGADSQQTIAIVKR